MARDLGDRLHAVRLDDDATPRDRLRGAIPKREDLAIAELPAIRVEARDARRNEREPVAVREDVGVCVEERARVGDELSVFSRIRIPRPEYVVPEEKP